MIACCAGQDSITDCQIRRSEVTAVWYLARVFQQSSVSCERIRRPKGKPKVPAAHVTPFMHVRAGEEFRTISDSQTAFMCAILANREFCGFPSNKHYCADLCMNYATLRTNELGFESR